MSNLDCEGDDTGNYGDNIFKVFSTFDAARTIWMRHDNFNKLVKELQGVKFTVQIERDRIPSIISKYNYDEPFGETERFRNGRWYSIPDGQTYFSRMITTSYFKNRADEVNRGRGNATNLPNSIDNSGSDGSRLQEDFQAPQDLRDATTQFARALQDFIRLPKGTWYITKFEREHSLSWHGSSIKVTAPSSSGAGISAVATTVKSGSGTSGTATVTNPGGGGSGGTGVST